MVDFCAMDNFEFVYELNRATNALNSYIDARIAERSGLTRAQCVALMLIDKSPDITKAALARKLNCSHVAVGRLASILTHKGYITAVPSVQNPHVVLLQATVDGKEMIAQVKLVFGQQSTHLFEHVEKKIDIAALSAELCTFTDILATYK